MAENSPNFKVQLGEHRRNKTSLENSAWAAEVLLLKQVSTGNEVSQCLINLFFFKVKLIGL